MRMIIRPLRRTFPLSLIRIFTLARANDTTLNRHPLNYRPLLKISPPPHDTTPGQQYPPAEV